MSVYVCRYMYACICMHVYVCISVHMYVCMYVCICMRVCMYMCVCIHVYVCMHNIWGGIVRGEMSYPKREGELSGELFIGEVFGGELSGRELSYTLKILVNSHDAAIKWQAGQEFLPTHL